MVIVSSGLNRRINAGRLGPFGVGTGAVPIIPPRPLEPLEVVIRENSGFTNFSQDFELATGNVVMGLACAFSGDPQITITHGGEPLTIVNRAAIQHETQDKRWLCILAEGRDLTIGVDTLVITCTGGELHGGALRIAEMATINTPEVGWSDNAVGHGDPIETITVGASDGGIIKGVFVNGAADRQHADKITGATDVFNGYTTTGDLIAFDFTTAGPWVLGAGWMIEGDDFVHYGPASDLSITFPVTTGYASARFVADIAPLGRIVVNKTNLDTYTAGLWNTATYTSWGISEVHIRATGDVRISGVSVVENACAVAWIFFSEPAVTGHEMSISMPYMPYWAWVASEINGDA